MTTLRWSRVDLVGPDAADFLQRLSTVRISALAAASQTGCFLSATGKIRAYFWITKISSTRFALEFDAGENQRWEKSLLDFLEQYKFSENFEIQKQTLSCRWSFGESSLPQPEQGIFSHGSLDFGREWQTTWGETEVPLPESVTEWRILQCRPWFDREILEDTNPLEVGLVDAVARGKGCFPGQEVTERIFTYGAPPRRLVQVRGLSDKGQLPAGLTSSFTYSDGRYIGLTIVSKMQANVGNLIPQGEIVKCAPFSDSV